MGQHAIATIVTRSFLHYAEAMHDTIERFDPSITFVAMVVDSEGYQLPRWAISTSELKDQPNAVKIINKYSSPDDTNRLRWALKSQLISFCLRKGATAVCWVDPDIMFVENPSVILNQIQPQQILLSPHYRSFRPSVDEENFTKNYTEGLFQAGFIGFGCGTETMLDWWAEACLWSMEKDSNRGTYVDQRFLDLLPIVWEDTVILRHMGCNLGEWNRRECHRALVGDTVLINGKYPVMFIHFTDCTVYEILQGEDPLLRSYLDKYVEQIRRFEPSFILRLPSNTQNEDSPRLSHLIQSKFRTLLTKARSLW